MMVDRVEGGCRCGAVRYHIAVDALPLVYACHCLICQRATGSAFSTQALVAKDRLTVIGPIVTREIVTPDPASANARVYNTNSARPGLAVVRAGTLDRSEELTCRAHIFVNYRQRWVRSTPLRRNGVKRPTCLHSWPQCRFSPVPALLAS